MKNGFRFAELARGESLQSPDVCDCCGREDLKKTIKLLNPEGRVVWFGVGCAAKAIGGCVTVKEVRRAREDQIARDQEIIRSEARAQEQAEDAKWQTFLDAKAPGHLAWDGRPDRFKQIEVLGGWKAARARYLSDAP